MIEHRFVKSISPIAKGGIAKVFGELEPVSKLSVSRYEPAIQTIRRALGDNFWDLDTREDDILDLVIDDMGMFNVDAIKENPQCIKNLVTFIINILNCFIAINGNSVDFSSDFMNKKLIKIGVTGENKGYIELPISLNDIKSVFVFDENNTVLGIHNYKEITNLTDEVTKQTEIYKKIYEIDAEKAKSVEDKIYDMNEKLIAFNIEAINIFFNIICTLFEIESIDDIYDIMCSASLDFINDTGEGDKSSIKQTIVYDYHEITAHDIKILKDKLF